jgi:hypothetical protein
MGKLKRPETEHGKLMDMLQMYEKILHPDVFQPLLRQLTASYEEAKVQAYRDAKISDEALQVEKVINNMKANMERIQDLSTFHIKCGYKQILKIFLK